NNECLDRPCLNSARCINNDGSFTCECTVGWIGLNCELDVNECRQSPCMNGGTCQNAPGYYTCTCPEGFIGIDCDT
ncbi:hypothetical protein ACJMK2_018637, partial [Sinanodonta woodiana]